MGSVLLNTPSAYVYTTYVCTVLRTVEDNHRAHGRLDNDLIWVFIAWISRWIEWLAWAGGDWSCLWILHIILWIARPAVRARHLHVRVCTNCNMYAWARTTH
eukprot:COSAG06_NODE_5294_length_3577_cov_3.642919_3_plen_102_part_00